MQAHFSSFKIASMADEKPAPAPESEPVTAPLPALVPDVIEAEVCSIPVTLISSPAIKNLICAGRRLRG